MSGAPPSLSTCAERAVAPNGSTISDSAFSRSARGASFRDAQRLKSVITWALELRLWVATCVAGLSLFSALVLELPWNEATTSALAVVFFATLALYNLDAGLDAREKPPSSRLRKRRSAHLALVGASVLVLLSLGRQLTPRALVLTGSGALLCSLYAVPFPRSRKPQRARRGFRLKAVPFLKAPFVGIAVGTAVVWVPLLAADARVSISEALTLTGALSFYCAANALLFDIPDVADDAREETPTVPLHLGLAKARSAGVALLIVGFFCSALFCWQIAFPAYSFGLFALGAALLVFTCRISFNTRRHLVALLVDGALLLPLVFQYLLRIYSALH